MEVYSSGAPESVLHASLPANNAPEVYSSNAPELLYGPRDFPPEILPGSGLETTYDGLEHAGPSKEDRSSEAQPRFFKTTRLWAGVVIGIIILAAIIAGAIGGSIGRHRSK